MQGAVSAVRSKEGEFLPCFDCRGFEFSENQGFEIIFNVKRYRKLTNSYRLVIADPAPATISHKYKNVRYNAIKFKYMIFIIVLNVRFSVL
jgi:hypothetical protein